MAYVVFYWQAPGGQKPGLIYFVIAELSLVPGTQQVVQKHLQNRMPPFRGDIPELG